MDPLSSANAQPRTVVDYQPDPRGTRFFRGLAEMAQAGIDGATGLIAVGDKGRAEATFNGYAGQRQAFSGQAALAAYGAATPITPGPARFEQEGAALDAFGNDLTMRIYAARARRRR